MKEWKQPDEDVYAECAVINLNSDAAGLLCSRCRGANLLKSLYAAKIVDSVFLDVFGGW